MAAPNDAEVSLLAPAAASVESQAHAPTKSALAPIFAWRLTPRIVTYAPRYNTAI
jgi:hypothetical protein